MKRLGLLGPMALGLLGLGCGGGEAPVVQPTATVEPAPPPPPPEPTAEPTPPPKPPLSELQKAFPAALDAAWASRDAKKVLALYTADVTFAAPGPRGWSEQKAGDTEAYLTGLFAAFPDAKMTTTRMIVKGDVALLEWVFTGTHKADYMGQKATNKPVGYRGASVAVFDADGKVKRGHMYMDMGTMMGQLGLGPKGQKVRAVEAAPTAPAELVFAKDGEEGKAAALLQQMYQAGEKKDDKATLALLADDAVVSNNYDPADQKKADFAKALPAMTKAFVDQKWKTAQCFAAGDYGVCEYEWTATWKGPAMGMKPTGKTGTVHAIEVAKAKDGKLALVSGYGNGAEFAFAFGLMDEKKDAGKAPAAPAAPAKDAGKAPAPAPAAPAKK